MLCLIMVKEGKIWIEDPVKKYLPEFEFDGILVKHLIFMMPGLCEYWTSSIWLGGGRATCYGDKGIMANLNDVKKVRIRKRKQPCTHMHVYTWRALC